MSDTKIPVKKLIDSNGKYYYPMSTTESVVTSEGITVKNSIGSYKPNDVIPEKTNLKTILFRILTATGEADAVLHLSNIDTEILSEYSTRIPSSPLVGELLQKLKQEIEEKLIKAAHYRGSVDYYKDLPTATALVGDIYNVRYRGTSGKQEDGNNYIFDDDNRTWDKLSGFADLGDFYTKSEIDTKLGNLKIYIDDQDNLIKNLYVKKSDATGTVSAEVGKCITGITQTDGKITSVTSAKLTTDVTVTPLLTSGAHIADITVDNNTSSIYAPANPYTAGIIETWRSGYSWYRLYSDGWIEQGGMASTETETKSLIIPFHKTMKDSYCSVQVTQDDETGNDLIVPFKKIHNQSRIIVSWNTITDATFQWECKGYIPGEPVTYYTVTFDANGGTSTESTRSVIANTQVGALPNASKPNHSFTGWYSERESGFRITNATVVSSNVTYYAHYSIDTCKITFNANGGITPETERTIAVGSQIGTLPIPTWENHTFLGWYTQQTGGSKIDDTTIFNVDSQLYAHWIIDVVTITFNPNGGTVEETSRTIVKNSAIGILPIPTLEGYQFEGWFTSISGGTMIETTTTFANDSIIYAQWSEISEHDLLSLEGDYPKLIITEDKHYNILIEKSVEPEHCTITFNANGGSVSPTTKDIEIGTQIGTLPVPTRNGYIFNGWYTLETGGIKVETTTIFNKDSEIFAHWTVDSVTVTLNPNGGTVSPTTKSVVRGTSVGTLPVPSYSGYEFTGWFTQSEGGDKILETTIVNSDVTYFAHWVEIETGELLSTEEDENELVITEDNVYFIDTSDTVVSESILASEVDHDPVDTEDHINNISLK